MPRFAVGMTVTQRPARPGSGPHAAVPARYGKRCPAATTGVQRAPIGYVLLWLMGIPASHSHASGRAPGPAVGRFQLAKTSCGSPFAILSDTVPVMNRPTRDGVSQATINGHAGRGPGGRLAEQSERERAKPGRAAAVEKRRRHKTPQGQIARGTTSRTRSDRLAPAAAVKRDPAAVPRYCAGQLPGTRRTLLTLTSMAGLDDCALDWLCAASAA